MIQARRIAIASAGPLLIAVTASFALRGFVFHPMITDAQPDILTFWLPRWAFLGRSLAAGHVPLWNPYELAGYRFAADPQSGFWYVPPMVLFTRLSPGAALRAFIVFNPIVAGLSLYAFLRIERLSRVAATAGALALALIMATSTIAISLPFAGMLAWTPVVLLSAAGYRRASRWSRRAPWMALSGLAWSQVACAHLSHGLVVCTTLVTAYLVAGCVLDVRAGRLRMWAAMGRTAAFLAFLPLAALPVLIPRLAFIGASSLKSGYEALGMPARSIAGIDQDPIVTNGVWAGWPFAFGVAPGAYAGATILIAIPLALRARQRRVLVWSFGVAFALTYVLMLNAVVTAGWFRASMGHLPFGDVYLHNPGRLRYLAVIAIPVLGAVGIQGLRDAPPSRRSTVIWIVAGIGLWLGVPLVAGGHLDRYALLAAASVPAALALWFLATRRGTWAAVAVVSLLALELVGSAVFSDAYNGDTVATGLEGGASPNLPPQPLPWPDISQSAFQRPGSFVPILASTTERYLPWAPPQASYEKGYLFMQEEPDWPALAMERGSLFGVRDALGYNPVQLPGYWTYLRAVDPLPMYYNAAVLNTPTLSALRTLGVRYLTVPTGVRVPLDGHVVASAGSYDLFEVSGWQPRVSVVSRWEVATGHDLTAAVADAGFDPARVAYVPADPGIPSASGGGGTAVYAEDDPEHVVIDANAVAPSIVVVRSAFDAGWTATVDGKPATVIPTDLALQGIAIPAGHHQIRLTYRDRDVARGVQAGIVVWLVLAVIWLGSLTLEWRARVRAARAPPVRSSL